MRNLVVITFLPVLLCAQQPAEEQKPAVVAAVIKVENANGKDGDTANLKNKIYVSVANLEAWTDRPSNPEEIILFLDDRPLKTVTASVTGPPKDGVTRIAFDLMPDYSDPDEARNWRRLLVSARRAKDGRVALSIGVAGKAPVGSGLRLKLNLERWYSKLIYLALVALAAGVVILARLTNLLRDGAPPLAPGQHPPYSLARTQMAIWFLIVLAAWCYVSLMTHSAAPLSDQVLGLIGISGATALAALAVDTGKWSKEIEERTALKKPEPVAPKSKGWLRDILSDVNGVSLHRLQIFVWTVTLAIYFLWSTLRDLVMPEFDNQLLVLMGISSGTYLGFKWPEKVVSKEDAGGTAT
ncbi:MAG TPA: hypothetical protein DEH78_28685 [Solibacterales bacterium]|nr:hypothetical protein [Bryobacterales bacterium]